MLSIIILKSHYCCLLVMWSLKIFISIHSTFLFYILTKNMFSDFKEDQQIYWLQLLYTKWIWVIAMHKIPQTFRFCQRMGKNAFLTLQKKEDENTTYIHLLYLKTILKTNMKSTCSLFFPINKMGSCILALRHFFFFCLRFSLLQSILQFFNQVSVA